MIGPQLKFIHESVKSLKEIAENLISLKNIIRKNPKFFGIIGGLIVIYLSFSWFSFDYPSLVIKRYYRNVGEKDFNAAWITLDEDYKDRRWKSYSDFAAMYATSTPYTALKIEYKGSKLNPFYGIFAPTLKYEVSFEVYERFTKEDLEKPGQLENSLWVQIYHKRDYPKLIDGSIGKDEFGSNPSLALRRYYKQIIIVKRRGLKDFRISAIQVIERGLRPLQSND